jgi:hypothetical protein
VYEEEGACARLKEAGEPLRERYRKGAENEGVGPTPKEGGNGCYAIEK